MISMFLLVNITAFAYDFDEEYFGAEPPPDNVPIDNLFFMGLILVMLSVFMVIKMKKKDKIC
jgi:hypothetical protein